MQNEADQDNEMRPYGAVGLGRRPADDPSPLFAYRVRALDGSRGPRPSHAEPEKRITAAGLMDLLADRHGVARWISAVRPTAARLFNDQPSDADATANHSLEPYPFLVSSALLYSKFRDVDLADCVLEFDLEGIFCSFTTRSIFKLIFLVSFDFTSLVTV
ncbi:hypothetical protein PVAP13_9KG266013 [Panicum virgatum]|uniref:Uncharacterized protein n=1 Tax=Panicum virgatum TaxID=38727 RepID=A0A8T0NJ79_PANVG|nr:hypothetical protein PVAP13_9KG266013 [Panicum virgatum]